MAKVVYMETIEVLVLKKEDLHGELQIQTLLC